MCISIPLTIDIDVCELIILTNSIYLPEMSKREIGFFSPSECYFSNRGTFLCRGSLGFLGGSQDLPESGFATPILTSSSGPTSAP